ncbi:ATP-binding protein [bacterium]|jgi:anti-sigma regulatory factor (Ser/Thr protein kinase)|nr:ATP-binding protein [bacterium]
MEVNIGQNQVLLQIKSDDKYLRLVRTMVEEISSLAGFASHDIADIVLAVDEACANIIKHAYSGDSTKDIFIKLSLLSNGIEVILKDYGRKVHPEKMKGRELDEIRPGGLGIYFMKKIMDSVQYIIHDDADGTELIMVKHVRNGGGREKKH